MHASWVLICEQHTVINNDDVHVISWFTKAWSDCNFEPCNETTYSILSLTDWKRSCLLSKRLDLCSLVAHTSCLYISLRSDMYIPNVLSIYLFDQSSEHLKVKLQSHNLKIWSCSTRLVKIEKEWTKLIEQRLAVRRFILNQLAIKTQTVYLFLQLQHSSTLRIVALLFQIHLIYSFLNEFASARWNINVFDQQRPPTTLMEKHIELIIATIKILWKKTLGKLDPRDPGLYSHACSISTEATFWFLVMDYPRASSHSWPCPPQDKRIYIYIYIYINVLITSIQYRIIRVECSMPKQSDITSKHKFDLLHKNCIHDKFVYIYIYIHT